MSPAWWSEIGLFLDLIAFAILSFDMVRSIAGETTAREEIYSLERKAFNVRYGFFAPSQDVIKQQDDEFDADQAERRRKSNKSILQRKTLAWFAIAIATVGFLMQIYGGWPR